MALDIEVIEPFYGAFASRDADRMEACYHPKSGSLTRSSRTSGVRMS